MHGHTNVKIRKIYQTFLESFLIVFLNLSFEKMKNYYVECRRRGTTYFQQKERRSAGLVISCVATTFCNTILKEYRRKDRKGWEYEEEEDVSSY